MQQPLSTPDLAGIRGIVFDAVGTLIEAYPRVAEAYTAAALRQHVVLNSALVHARFREHFATDEAEGNRGSMSTNESREKARWRKLVAKTLPEVPDPERAFRELWDHFAQASSWQTFPDVGPAIESLRDAGIALGIGSNFDARLRSLVAGLPELAPLSDAIVISSDVGFRKPHPAFYAAACARLQLPADQVLFVGDDPEADFAAPQRAGFRSALVERENVSPPLSSFPDLTALSAAVLR
jgi:putative hydrolase of the HAD superfamily